MFRGRTATVAAALVVAAAAVFSAGCGGGSTSSALSLDPVAAAVTKTQNAGAARIRLSVAVTGQGRAVKLRGAGAMDGTSSKLTFEAVSLAGLPPAVRSQLGHGSIQEVALEQDGDYVLYIRVPSLASQLPGGQQWFKLDLSKLGASTGLDLGKLMSGSQLQPTDLLSTLEADGAKVHRVGPATVDGAATTHYRVTVDTAKVLESIGPTSPLLSAAAAQMKSITENVWVGKDGLVRRIAFAGSVPRASSPHMAMTMDIYDYGAHVHIAAPPSSQVFDATQLAQQGLASATH